MQDKDITYYRADYFYQDLYELKIKVSEASVSAVSSNLSTVILYYKHLRELWRWVIPHIKVDKEKTRKKFNNIRDHLSKVQLLTKRKDHESKRTIIKDLNKLIETLGELHEDLNESIGLIEIPKIAHFDPNKAILRQE